jgi:hypothetical protein
VAVNLKWPNLIIKILSPRSLKLLEESFFFIRRNRLHGSPVIFRDIHKWCYFCGQGEIQMLIQEEAAYFRLIRFPYCVGRWMETVESSDDQEKNGNFFNCVTQLPSLDFGVLFCLFKVKVHGIKKK